MIVDSPENRQVALESAPFADQVIWHVGGLYTYRCEADAPDMYDTGESVRLGWLFLEVAPTSPEGGYEVFVTAARVASESRGRVNLLPAPVPWNAEGTLQGDSSRLTLSYSIEHRDEKGTARDTLSVQHLGVPSIIQGIFEHTGVRTIRGRVAITKVIDGQSVPDALRPALTAMRLRKALPLEVVGRRGRALARIYRSFGFDVTGSDMILDIVTQQVRYVSQGSYRTASADLMNDSPAAVLYTEPANGSPLYIRGEKGGSRR